MIELAIGIGVVAVATIAAVRSRNRLPPPPVMPAPDPLEDGRLGVGDVLLYLDSELWLAGCVSLHESGPVLRLFPTPEDPRAEFVMELPRPLRRWVVLRRTTAVEPGAVPERLHVDGLPLALERRGLARVYTTGEHLPKTTDRAEFTVHRGPGGQYAVVLDFLGAGRLALAGEELRPELVDRLPGSGALAQAPSSGQA
jgi:hypothetical protein